MDLHLSQNADNKRGKSRSARSGAENDHLVYQTLLRANTSLTAYQILDRLRNAGVSGPPTVYRALERLIERGDVHRIESLNAYVICRSDEHGPAATFVICDGCGSVVELADHLLDARLTEIAEKIGFEIHSGGIEMHGKCAECRTEDENLDLSK